jgi:hypothetical protein
MRYKVLGFRELGIGKKEKMYLTDTRIAIRNPEADGKISSSHS